MIRGESTHSFGGPMNQIEVCKHCGHSPKKHDNPTKACRAKLNWFGQKCRCPGYVSNGLCPAASGSLTCTKPRGHKGLHAHAWSQDVRKLVANA